MPIRSRKNNLFKTRMSKRRKRVSTRQQRGGEEEPIHGEEEPIHGIPCENKNKFVYVAKTYKRGNLKDVPKVLICKKSRKMPFSNKKLSSQLPNNKQKGCMNKHCYHLPTAYERLIYRKQIKEAKLRSLSYRESRTKSLKTALEKLKKRLNGRTKRKRKNRSYMLRNNFVEQGAKAGFQKEIEKIKKELEEIKEKRSFNHESENEEVISNLIKDCESLIKRIKEDTRTKIQSNNNNNLYL